MRRRRLRFGIRKWTSFESYNCSSASDKTNCGKREVTNYSPATPPESVTVRSTPDGTFTVEEVDARGKPTKFSQPWSGGTEVPVNGVENATWISSVHAR